MHFSVTNKEHASFYNSLCDEDSDYLEDLKILFGAVGNRTDTLVELCTAEILLRPWCVGEMVTARLHDIDTFLIRLPDFWFAVLIQ